MTNETLNVLATRMGGHSVTYINRAELAALEARINYLDEVASNLLAAQLKDTETISKLKEHLRNLCPSEDGLMVRISWRWGGKALVSGAIAVIREPEEIRGYRVANVTQAAMAAMVKAVEKEYNLKGEGDDYQTHTSPVHLRQCL